MKNILILIFILFTTSTFAGQGDDTLGGCGLGNIIAPQNSMVSLSTRSTTNSSTTFSFGTTSGTSGCAQHSIVMNHKMDQYMAEISFDEILADIANGGGEHFAAFSRAVGCNDDRINYLSSQLRNNFETISDSKNATEFIGTVHKIIKNDQKLTKGCTI